MSTRREFLKQWSVASAVGVASPSVLARAVREAGDVKTPPGAIKPARKGVLELAIVGTGQISHRYLKQAQGDERARFVATCARTLESAKARANEYGVGAWFDDYKTMLDKVRPEGVVIATPTALHAEQTIAALERGIPVLCEKPMARTLDECRSMVAAAEREKVVYLNLPYDASPSFLAALEYLNEATLGVFTGAEANLSLPGTSRDNWYYDIQVAGGGAGLDTLVYPVSKLISLLGPARRVTGFINTLIPQRILGDGETIDSLPPPRDPAKGKVVKPTVDDNATLVIEWAGGQNAVVRTLWGTSFVNNTAAIYGRHGTLWTGVFGNDVVIHSPERAIPEAESVTWNGQKDCYKVPIKEIRKNEGLVDHFIDCILGVAQPTCSGQQALHVHEILFKGYEAARTGRVQELETTFTTWHPIEPSFLDTRSRPI
jgi:predicted dehydrogenase